VPAVTNEVKEGGPIGPAEEARQAELTVADVHLNFGGVAALQGVSLTVGKGEIVSIIGPNGAGKTCLINCISGFYRPQRGEILFAGSPVTRLPAHEISTLGIARTFQNIALFGEMTTLQTLMTARHRFLKRGLLAGALFFGPALREEIRQQEHVEEIIKFLGLGPVRGRRVGTLSYGLRKRIELGRALALQPKLLLLDEPMAGMNVEEKEDMTRFILDAKELTGTTVLLVEHDMGVVMDIADRIVVLDFGRKIAEGTPGQIESNPEVIKAYLGGMEE